MGQPSQEYLAEDLFVKHEALYICVGGSFDVYSGVKKRAPKFFQFMKLEWFYRLCQEPKRIGRYMKLFKFLPYLISIVLYKRKKTI